MKSLLSGAFWGFLFGGAALSAVSLATPQPAGNLPPSQPLTAAPDTAPELPEADDAPAAVAEVNVEAVEPVAPDELETIASGALPEADTAPPPAPELQEVETALVAPESTDVPQIPTADEVPVLPAAQSVAPQVPTSEDTLVVSTEPAPLPVEETPEPIVADADVTSAPETEDPVAAQVIEVTEDAPATPDPVVEPQAPEIPTQTVEVETPQADTTPPDDAPSLDAPSDLTPDPIVVADASAPEPPLEEDAPVVVADANGTARVSVMPGSSTGVVVNRGALGTQDETTEAPEEEVVEIDPDAPAIERYAAEFENADGKPTMSILIIDDGSLQGAVAAVAQVPFPVTVALDPTADGAADAMAAYRAAGIEVAMKAKLPAGARPADVEVVLAAAFATLPETVVMVETGDGNLLEDRDVLAQAIAALAADGRGLLTISQGLNTGLRTAEAADVPAGLIFRDLDSEGQDARVIQRFLDQAAFRARREDGVVLMARIRAETLTALTQWGEANSAAQVAMAPVSATLTSQ